MAIQRLATHPEYVENAVADGAHGNARQRRHDGGRRRKCGLPGEPSDVPVVIMSDRAVFRSMPPILSVVLPNSSGICIRPCIRPLASESLPRYIHSCDVRTTLGKEVMAGDLSKLACGDPSGNAELSAVLIHIGTMLDLVMDEVRSLHIAADKRVTLFGPFLGRSLIELCVTALIARLDPFRVLLIREMQLRPGYTAGTRLKSAIQWQGDVLQEKVSDMWSAEKPAEKAGRALLGDYYGHLVLCHTMTLG